MKIDLSLLFDSSVQALCWQEGLDQYRIAQTFISSWNVTENLSHQFHGPSGAINSRGINESQRGLLSSSGHQPAKMAGVFEQEPGLLWEERIKAQVFHI